MRVACLDLEGVLIPEIWIAVADKTGIEELRKTTRDISDYHVLMKMRLKLLESHGITIDQIQEIINSMEPLRGARSFLDGLREKIQVIILSDTFNQFAKPMLRKLAWPTLFCNDLEIDESGKITGYRLRQENGKESAVKALRSINLEVTAVGDSYNDLSMLKAAHEGILFKPPEAIQREYSEFKTAFDYPTLLEYLDC